MITGEVEAIWILRQNRISPCAFVFIIRFLILADGKAARWCDTVVTSPLATFELRVNLV